MVTPEQRTGMSDTTQNNGASLKQGIKILGYLEGTDREQIQAGIESGFFSTVLRNGNLKSTRDQNESERISLAWEVIGTLTDLEDIKITVPRVPNPHSQQIGRAYELRCWKGPYGSAHDGHIDSGSASGVLLFETFVPEPLKECACCFPEQLRRAGISITGKYLAKVETKVAQSRGTSPGMIYDVVTFSVW